MICVFATDTVASVNAMPVVPLESVSVRLSMLEAPTGPKLVPVMVMVLPAVDDEVIEVMFACSYFMIAAFVTSAPSVVPLFEISREKVFEPAPAGAVKVICVLAVDTVALLPDGVTTVDELSHTIFMMLDVPVGPKLVPVTVIVPPDVGTVSVM